MQGTMQLTTPQSYAPTARSANANANANAYVSGSFDGAHIRKLTAFCAPCCGCQGAGPGGAVPHRPLELGRAAVGVARCQSPTSAQHLSYFGWAQSRSQVQSPTLSSRYLQLFDKGFLAAIVPINYPLASASRSAAPLAIIVVVVCTVST